VRGAVAVAGEHRVPDGPQARPRGGVAVTVCAAVICVPIFLGTASQRDGMPHEFLVVVRELMDLYCLVLSSCKPLRMGNVAGHRISTLMFSADLPKPMCCSQRRRSERPPLRPPI